MTQDLIKKKIRDGLGAKAAKIGRDRALGAIKPAMLKMSAHYPKLREELRSLKEYSITHLDEMIHKASTSMTARGCKVFVADSTQDALEYIGAVVGKGLVVKSKTNAGKEIGLPQYLEQHGARIVETDLGDRINQLDGGVASHSLAPAIHVPIERVAELFSREVNETLPPELDCLVQAARRSLRQFLEQADVGISGANAVVADTGAIVVTENEGNIRAVTSMPRIHIVVAGVEKIVPTQQDAITVIKAAAVFGVGQDIGTYISFVAGPSRFDNDDYAFLGAAQGPEEVHVVLLKGGREKTIREGYEETLYCINCGSCLNFCPVYSAIGEKFGYKYLGGRGAVFTAMYEKLEKAQEAGLSLCMGCKRCEEACAVGMKTPRMIARLREKAVDDQGLPSGKKMVFGKMAANKLPAYLRLARKFQALGLKRRPDGMAQSRIGMDSMGMPSERLVPPLAEKTFNELMSLRPVREQTAKTVAFFAGCVVNYARPDLGEKLVDILETQKVMVKFAAEELCCGIPVLQSGDREDGREMARRNVQMLSAMDFEHLVFVCPTCATTIKNEWPRLLAKEGDLGEKAVEIAAKVMDISDYLVNVLQIPAPSQSVSCRATYHDSCHLGRGLKITAEPRKLIAAIPGVQVQEMAEPNSCCGFGGSFSMYYYDLSKKINDEKIRQIEDTGADCVVTGCPGCLLHLKDGIARNGGRQQVVHTVELLAKAYGKDGNNI